MAKQKFKVAVEWVLSAQVEIMAETLDEAKALAEDVDLPEDGEFMDGSFLVMDELTDELNSPDTAESETES